MENAIIVLGNQASYDLCMGKNPHAYDGNIEVPRRVSKTPSIFSVAIYNTFGEPAPHSEFFYQFGVRCFP